MLFCQDFQGMPYSTSSHPSDCVRQVVRQNIHHRKVEYINMLPFADNTHFSVLSVHINLQEYESNNEQTHHESRLACRCCNRAHTGIVSEDSSMIMQLKDRFDDAQATHIDITHKSVLGGVTTPRASSPCHRATEGGHSLIAHVDLKHPHPSSTAAKAQDVSVTPSRAVLIWLQSPHNHAPSHTVRAQSKVRREEPFFKIALTTWYNNSE